MTFPIRVHYLIEEFDIPYEYKRQLAEFVTTVERLYYAVEELREKLAQCSAYIKRASGIEPSIINIRSNICRMSIADRYLRVKLVLAELSAHSNLDRVIEKILELLSKPS
jgi:uncharacterized protein YPO0396